LTDKKNLYILLPAVAVVWGMILYRIINGLSPDQPKALYAVKETGDDEIKIDSLDNELLLNYRDPFYSISEEIYKPVLSETNLTRKQSTLEKKDTPLKLERFQIKYFGMMQNHKTQKKMALIILNGAYHYVEKGTEVDLFKIVQITPDSIGISIENQTHYFRKKK
jgi:hypothetical protein